MSEVTTSIDAATELAAWIRRVSTMYTKDLKAIPESAFAVSQGGKARTVQDFTSEVCRTNRLVAFRIRTGEFPKPEDALVSSIEEGVREILDSAEDLAQAIEEHKDRLSEMAETSWGEPMKLYTLGMIAANHILYHDGQLALVQYLLGDENMHWRDE